MDNNNTTTAKYTIEQAGTKHRMNDFVRVTSRIYKGCPYYVPDLVRDIKHMFVEKYNPGLKTSEVMPFVAYNSDGEPVGRIVGIVNHKANKIWNTNNIRFGMIEFIDDVELVKLLIDTVEQWGKNILAKTDMAGSQTRIQGPLGVTDFDKEGMLVESFDEMGSMATIYNHAYYPQRLEELGFQKEVDWIQLKMDIPSETPKRYARAAKLVSEMYELKVRTLTHDEVFKQGYGLRVFHLLNKAYKPLFGFAELSDEQSIQFVEQYMPLIDMRMMPVVVDKDDNIIAIAITLGSLSKALQKSHGHMFPTGWFHLVKSLKLKNERKVEMMLIGIDPEYQGLGINSMIFDYLIPVYNQLGYTWAETCHMLESNLKVLTQWKPMNPTAYKRRRCYYRDINM